jgi:protein-L-isoaspartate(D-aspartate) O-methyltransferase
MLKPVEEARHSYAAELRFTARMRSSALVNAFATVPREQFVGPGPWRIKSPMDLAEYWTTDDDDPSQVYHDVLIASMSRAASTMDSRAFGRISDVHVNA